MTAFPAACVRILMGNQKEPPIRFTQKIVALVVSLFFAAMAGQVARQFTQTTGYATVIVIAAAFTAQDALPLIIRLYKKIFKSYANKWFKE